MTSSPLCFVNWCLRLLQYFLFIECPAHHYLPHLILSFLSRSSVQLCKKFHSQTYGQKVAYVDGLSQTKKRPFSISELIPDLPTSSCWVFLPVKWSSVRWGSWFRIRLIKCLLPFIRSSASGVIQKWQNSKICESHRACEILAGSIPQQVAGNANKEWSLSWSAVEGLSFWDYSGFSLWKLN